MGVTIQLGPSPEDIARWKRERELEEKMLETQRLTRAASQANMSVIQFGFAIASGDKNFISFEAARQSKASGYTR